MIRRHVQLIERRVPDPEGRLAFESRLTNWPPRIAQRDITREAPTIAGTAPRTMHTRRERCRYSAINRQRSRSTAGLFMKHSARIAVAARNAAGFALNDSFSRIGQFARYVSPKRRSPGVGGPPTDPGNKERCARPASACSPAASPDTPAIWQPTIAHDPTRPQRGVRFHVHIANAQDNGRARWQRWTDPAAGGDERHAEEAASSRRRSRISYRHRYSIRAAAGVRRTAAGIVPRGDGEQLLDQRFRCVITVEISSDERTHRGWPQQLLAIRSWLGSCTTSSRMAGTCRR